MAGASVMKISLRKWMRVASSLWLHSTTERNRSSWMCTFIILHACGCNRPFLNVCFCPWQSDFAHVISADATPVVIWRHCRFSISSWLTQRLCVVKLVWSPQLASLDVRDLSAQWCAMVHFISTYSCHHFPPGGGGWYIRWKLNGTPAASPTPLFTSPHPLVLWRGEGFFLSHIASLSSLPWRWCQSDLNISLISAAEVVMPA